jgi:hypothetical protein
MDQMECDVCGKRFDKLKVITISEALTREEIKDCWTVEKNIYACKYCADKINFRNYENG